MNLKHIAVTFALLHPAASFAQSIEFGNIGVVQNDANNTSASVTLSKSAGSSANFSLRGGNRGDYDVAFATADDVAAGVMLSSISQNGRDNTASGDSIGLFYATSGTDNGAVSGAAGKLYTVPIFRAAVGDEVNINIACAWFPYNQWLGGFARNSTSANGGANNVLTASAGINLGKQYVDGSGGVSTLNLTTLNASSASGILLVNSAKNEDNYALSKANSDGTFTIWSHDNGSNGASYEQDPVAFVYIPTSAVGTKQLVAMGRVNSDATTDVSGGTFTLTKGGTGQWYLSIPNQNNTTGVLLISPEGGGTNTADNIVSSEWDSINNYWIIESRDISGATNNPTLQNGATNDEDMFSFAFFASPNIAPTASLSAPTASSFITPGNFTLEVNATDTDGSIARVDFLRNGMVIGSDTTAPYSFTESNLPNGVYKYTARAVDNLGTTGSTPMKEITVGYDPANIPANTALQFDGDNDYVTMGPAPELNVGAAPGNGLTLECWFRKEGSGKTTGSGSGGVTAVPLFGKGRGESDGSNVDCNIFFGINTAGILVADFESQATGLNHPITATNAPITDGVWYHAAVTYDGATSTWRMYLNGTLVGSASASVANAVPRYDSIQHFGIGTAMNSTGAIEGAFCGVIDEARVWDHARTATEITGNKDRELASGSGLLGRFGLNEGTGTNTFSSIGSSNGTLVNNPAWVAGAPFTISNASPTVALTTPIADSSHYLPYAIPLGADATDADTGIAKVEFFVNGAKVAEDTTAPYNYAWTPSVSGDYAITARAQDLLGAGALSSSHTIHVLVNPNQSPAITLTTPVNGATINSSTTTLTAQVNDPESDATTVTFYGRQTVPTTPEDDFTLVAIPDTQYYAEGSISHATTVSTDELVATFGAQTQWIVDNKAQRKIAFVSHMGDIVNNGNFNGDPIQWERASSAMSKLENPITTLRAHGIPYGLAPGNHDIDPIGAYDTGSTLFYNRYFSTSRFNGRNYWGGNYGTDNTNNYQLFSAGGMDFITVHLSYDTTPNQDILDWADALLKAYPNRRAIITSHYIIGQGNPASFSTQGSAIYENLKDNPNLFLLLCGHIHAEGFRSDTYEGRTVYSVLSDYQGLDNGGNGFLRTFTFSPSNNRIRVESWSPTLNRATRPSDNLPHFDGTFDLPYNMQSAVNDWVALGTVTIPAGQSSASLQWTGMELGKNYEWYAAATDGINVASSSPNRFSTTPGSAPSVTLDSPLAGIHYLSPATIQLTATADDADGSVTRVEFYHEGEKIGEDSTAPYECTWSGMATGNYTLSAVAVDNDNLTALSNPVPVTVDPGDKMPIVSLTAPENNAVFDAPANFSLKASASDEEGPVSKVEFYSGRLTPVLVGTDSTEPYELSLNDVAPGSYVYTARVTDSAGQTTTSAEVLVNVYVEAQIPNPMNVSVGTFDLPTWTVVTTSPEPLQFNQPGTDVGDLQLRINGSSIPFTSGITLANNWSGPNSGNNSKDNLVQPYADAVGNLFVSILDNSNNNAAGANPSTSEESSGVSVAFLPYASGFTGASVSSDGSLISSNLPAGVSISKEGGSGTYSVNGLSIKGTMLAFTNGNTGTLADNICSVRIANGRWIIDTRDNAGGTQDNEFSFVYLPPSGTGVFAGAISGAGVVSATNQSCTAIGTSTSVTASGITLTFGDGTVINPKTAALFLCADATNGGAASPAVDNLITWYADGDGFHIFTQDLEGVSGTHENIDLRFVAIPYVAIPSQPEVSITANDATAGEYGPDQTLAFTISRTGSTTQALAITLSASGTAETEADYSGFQSSLTIPAGQTSVTLPLTVKADALAEGAETVVMSIISSNSYALGAQATAYASITDKPSQDYLFHQVTALDKRGPEDDADGDDRANVIEYFMGSDPANAGNHGSVQVPEAAAGKFKVRFPHAKNRGDVQGSLEWSSDLINWQHGGESDGTHTLQFSEAVISPVEADPETVEVTVTVSSGITPQKVFFRLNVK